MTTRLGFFITLSVCFLLPPSVGRAQQIEKFSKMGDNGIQLYWWPKLRVPTGWMRDQAASEAHEMIVLHPKGQTFDNAYAVIYAHAYYEPVKQMRPSLKELVDDDIKATKEHNRNAVISIIEPGLAIRNGHHLKTFRVVIKGQTYEEVCYGAEGDYNLNFVVSANSERGFRRALPLFKAILKGYK